jgi:AraC-like DNA-binding protein
MPSYYEPLSLSKHIKVNVSYDTALKCCDAHWHSEIEIVAPMQEGYELSVNFSSRILGEEDIGMIFPGEIHSTRSNGQSKALVLQFSPSIVKTVYEIGQRWSVFTARRFITEREEPGLPALLLPYLREMTALRATQPAFKEADYYSLLLRFFSTLGRYRIEKEELEPQEQSFSNYTEKMAEACSYIEENIARQISLEEAARFAGFSKFHFSRLFKKFTGMTFSEYIADARLKKVELLLADESAKIADIALESGFGSLSAFNRVFKKRKGVSPNEFRRLRD